MGLENLQIIFDNPTAVFEPGQSITGRVLVVANSSIKIKKIKLKFKGEGRVGWKEQETRTNSKNESEDYYESYDALEEYLNYKIVLAESGENRTTKLEGEHVYPFSVPLPLQLPSTFKEEYGEVQYKALVTIVVPWSLNKRTEVDFEIKSLLNLNDEPSLAEPKIQETEKYFCCCFCKSGPMTMVVYLPYCGFVPGQLIPVTIEIDNNTNVDVETVKIRLDRVEACVKGGHINEKASIGLTLGDVPLTIARNPSQYGHVFQAPNQYFAPHKLFPKDSYKTPMDINNLLPLPGYAQKIEPSANDQNFVLPSISSSINTVYEKNPGHKPLNSDQPPPYQFSDTGEMSSNNNEQ